MALQRLIKGHSQVLFQDSYPKGQPHLLHSPLFINSHKRKTASSHFKERFGTMAWIWTLHPPSSKAPKDKETWRFPSSLQIIWNQENFNLIHHELKHPHVGSLALQNITREFHSTWRCSTHKLHVLILLEPRRGDNNHSSSNLNLDCACINLFRTHFQAWPFQYFRVLPKHPLQQQPQERSCSVRPSYQHQGNSLFQDHPYLHPCSHPPHTKGA